MSTIVPRFKVPFFSLFQNVFSFSSWKIYLIWKWELPIHKMFTLPLFLLLLLLVAASGRWNTWVEAGVGVEAGSAALLNINRRSAVHGTTHVLQWRSTRAWAHWGCGAESWAGSGELSSQLLDAACLSPAWTYAWAAAHWHSSAHPKVALNVELIREELVLVGSPPSKLSCYLWLSTGVQLQLVLELSLTLLILNFSNCFFRSWNLIYLFTVPVRSGFQSWSWLKFVHSYSNRWLKLTQFLQPLTWVKPTFFTLSSYLWLLAQSVGFCQ